MLEEIERRALAKFAECRDVNGTEKSYFKKTSMPESAYL